jgi:hypothetical protein
MSSLCLEPSGRSAAPAGRRRSTHSSDNTRRGAGRGGARGAPERARPATAPNRAENRHPPRSPRASAGCACQSTALRRGRKGKRLVKEELVPPLSLSPQQRLLILIPGASGLPAGDFATLVGVSKHSLYAWKRLRYRGSR